MHVIGTAGHVDHGKSTLVKALTGIDPDRLEEEKERGLTIDLGFAWTTLPSGREVGIVDVPGHERFIRNMLAGVGGIDAALFVVAADEGWMPQSSEHLDILDFLQVRTGLVALTKIDLVDEETSSLAAEEVSERLRGTTLEGAPIRGVSATTGAGLDVLRKELDDLLGAAGEASDRGRPRLFVDRSFTITGAGTVVTGTLTGGRLRTGDEVEVVPGGGHARIRSLQTHQRTVSEAVPGSRVAANLVGLERSDVARGDAVVQPEKWQLSDTFAARLRTAARLDHPIAERGAYELYIGSVEVRCRLKFLEDPPATSGRLPALPAGASILAQVFCLRPVPLEPGDRFIVRDVGRWQTVAGGVVLDHFPGRVRRNDPEVIERLRAREAASRTDLVPRLLAERRVVAIQDLGNLAGLGPHEVEAEAGRATSAHGAVRAGPYLVDSSHADALLQRAAAVVRSHHDAHPLEPGIAREALRVALDVDQKLFAALMELWAGGELVFEGAVIRHADHGLTLSPEDQSRASDALRRLNDAGIAPPDVAELGLSRELLKAMERRGDLVLITPQIAYAAGAMRDIERKVIGLIEGKGPVTVADVRDAIGTTRKYAVPLLEHFDASGLTRRQGDTRVLGPRGRKIAEEK